MDASIVENTMRALDVNARAMQFSMNGANTTELRVLAPLVARAQPRAVVFTLRTADLGDAPDLQIDKANTYAYVNIDETWPPGWTKEDILGLSNQAWSSIKADDLRITAALRGVPLNAMENELLLKLRRGVRRNDPDEWIAPYVLVRSIKGDALQRHINEIEQIIESVPEAGTEDGRDAIESLARLFSESDIPPILVMAPVHPELRTVSEPINRSLRGLLERLAREHDGLFLDATTIFGAEGFADAMHPNETGRAIYSRFVGRELAPFLESREVN